MPRWIEILTRAAIADPDGSRDLKQDRSRRRRRRRQQVILAAATRILARDGIAKAKMADVAAVAGIPVLSNYDYYPSKADLAHAIPISASDRVLCRIPGRSAVTPDNARSATPLSVHGERLMI